MAEDNIVMTGAEFNAKYGKKHKMVKVLNRDLMHYTYKYKPNALNELEPYVDFNPNAECKPGGLYFCKSKHIFTFAHMFGFDKEKGTHAYPLIAEVVIPDDSRVSTGTHKFKTDKLILGQPAEINEYITNEWILKRSSKKINTMLSYCYMFKPRSMNSLNSSNLTNLAKRAYPLCSNKHKITATNKLHSMKNAAKKDIEFLAYVLRDLDVSNMSRSDYSQELYSTVCEFVKWIAKHEYLPAIRCCVAEGVSFNLNNNRMLRAALEHEKWDMVEYLVGIGFDINSMDGRANIIITSTSTNTDRARGCGIFLGGRQIQISGKISLSLLEIALVTNDLWQAKQLIDLGADINMVRDHVLTNNYYDKKFIPFIFDNGYRFKTPMTESIEYVFIGLIINKEPDVLKLLMKRYIDQGQDMDAMQNLLNKHGNEDSKELWAELGLGLHTAKN